MVYGQREQDRGTMAGRGKTVIMLDGTGIGETYLDDWLDVYIKAEQKKAFSVLTDGTNEYTDSNGNIYINN